jgi:hypothetical protein
MGVSDNKLRRVRLIHSNPISSDFSRFEQLLSGKYGPSMQKDESTGIGHSYNKNCLWSFPSTKIELTYSDVPRFFSILNIVYTDNSFLKSETDKL